MNPLLKAREPRHYLGDSGARLVFAAPMAAAEASAGAAEVGAEALTVTDELLDEITRQAPAGVGVERSDDDTAVVLYTSGTTGTPKGAQLTHANMRRNCEVAPRRWFDIGPDDVIMAVCRCSTRSVRPVVSTRRC